MRMAITMGDASGVGPEILLRRFAAGDFGDDLVVYGDHAVLQAGMALLNLDVPLKAIDSAGAAVHGHLNIIDHGLLQAADLTPGILNEAAGAAARAYVLHAVDDALAGKVAGVVTLPMNKEATQRSDPDFIGHTELIAERCGADDYAMMLTTDEVVASHVSAHVSLREAIERVTPERISTVVRLTHRALQAFIDQPRIAVCGLNPHAGEHGMFGSEDEEIIAPTIAALAAEGIIVTGPHPADTVFYQAIYNDAHDGVICMYHDQGHAPLKLQAFERGVNVTIGLPIVRTSVDHGTAFDIAWQGKAFTHSLDHALRWAWKLRGGRG